MTDVANAPRFSSREARRSLDAILPGLRDGLCIVAARRLGSVDDAEDAVQETIARLLVVVEAGKIGSAIEIRPVAYGILRHVIADQIRLREKEAAPLDTPDPSAGALERMIRREDLDAARRAVAELPEDDRELLRRCFVAGEAVAQIAASTGQSAERLRQRKSRAIRRLAAMLKATDRSRLPAEPDVES